MAPGGSAKLDVRIPQLIAYQGKLTDSTGRPVDDGSYVMVFSLSADSTGSSFWHETQTVRTKGGLFNLLLGSNVPIPIDAIPQDGCYLGIRVLPSTQEFHRQRIVSVPFAFQADNADKLQGRDTAAFDSLYIGHTDTNAVTSVLIADGTITRADVAPSFAAPYADTADYARLASDSARVAANAYLLLGKDTTALWNAKTLQGMDTTGFVRTGQTDAVTSAMIAPNTIVRADVAADFKAPFSDTADYATAAPASDSAGVAGNSHLLQGKDTTALDVRYVNEGQVGSITSPMIQDTTVNSVHIRDSAVTAGKMAAGAVSSVEIADNSVTTADIMDGTITSADIAPSGAVAGTYGDGYHVARITVDSAGRLTAVQDSTILGAAPTGPAGGDLSGNYPSPAIAVNVVTSAKILDGTIARADVTTDFKAPFADTADYAYAAPASDSARVAGNSHLLQNKDTTALWNAKTLQGKDTTGFVRTNQANSISSAMIADGTVVRSDVAAGFKAPYADTADYAAAAPASDSARVAGNSHLLQGKDTTDLWNAKTLQGRDTTALWNAKMLQGKDTTGFVRTGQADAVTSSMIVSNTIVRNDVATDFKAPFADTADYATAAPASDSARVAGNSHLLQTKDTTDLWNAKTLQGKDTTAFDARYVNESQTAGGDLAGNYPNPTIAADKVTSAKIVDGTIVRADAATDFKAPYADTADYASAAPATDSARVAGNSHLLQDQDTTALWNAKTLQGKDTTGFVRTGQANSITTGMITDGEVQAADIADANVTAAKIAAGAVDSTKIADGSVLGADIEDGTITSADIAASGVTAGTYGDGYHVARITVDSAGRLTAASDTTILGASPTGPAGGDLTGNYPNPAIATNVVTSAKILDGTIEREDAAADFKAPYSDTADYAMSAPATDSARVAGNSHLLQNKDTTDLWNAKTLQGKDTSALDARYVNESQTAGGDLTGTYPSPAIAANAVTLAKITRGSSPDSGKAITSLGSGTDPVWGYPAAVGDSSPTTMKFLRFGTVVVDFPSFNGPATVETTATIVGVRAGDQVFVFSSSSFDTRVALSATCSVTADDIVRLRACLPSNQTVDPASDTMRYLWIRP